MQLTTTETLYRTELEKLTRFTSIDTASALYEIKTYRNGVLWQEYGSFVKYCQKKWKYSRAQIYRMLATGSLVNGLKKDLPKSKLPINEGQLRPLLMLAEDLRAKVWIQLTDKLQPSALPYSKVLEEVQRLKGKTAGPAHTGTSSKSELLTCLAKVEASTRLLPEATRIVELLAKIKELALLEAPACPRVRRDYPNQHSAKVRSEVHKQMAKYGFIDLVLVEHELNCSDTSGLVTSLPGFKWLCETRKLCVITSPVNGLLDFVRQLLTYQSLALEDIHEAVVKCFGRNAPELSVLQLLLSDCRDISFVDSLATVSQPHPSIESEITLLQELFATQPVWDLVDIVHYALANNITRSKCLTVINTSGFFKSVGNHLYARAGCKEFHPGRNTWEESLLDNKYYDGKPTCQYLVSRGVYVHAQLCIPAGFKQLLEGDYSFTNCDCLPLSIYSTTKQYRVDSMLQVAKLKLGDRFSLQFDLPAKTVTLITGNGCTQGAA